MDLREYLFRERMTVADFARKLDYSRVHISGIVNGTLNASAKLARAIEKATEGKVKAEIFVKKKKIK